MSPFFDNIYSIHMNWNNYSCMIIEKTIKNVIPDRRLINF